MGYIIQNSYYKRHHLVDEKTGEPAPEGTTPDSKGYITHSCYYKRHRLVDSNLTVDKESLLGKRTKDFHDNNVNNCPQKKSMYENQSFFSSQQEITHTSTNLRGTENNSEERLQFNF